MGERNHKIEDQANSDYAEDAFTELATRFGMKALLKLISDQAITGGQGKLRIIVNDEVWEISAKCLLRKGPWVCCLAVMAGLG